MLSSSCWAKAPETGRTSRLAAGSEIAVLYHAATMETAATTTQPADNLPELSVSELSGSIKRTVEQAFDRVRVRGEIGRVTLAGSGHMYLSMKEDNAVLDCVCWRNTVNRLAHMPEQGLEMVATGRLTTYPGRSSYQLVVESIEPAGVGALMALLEQRRKQLGAEGLFDEDRKQPIPYLPAVIGVVTSPTGAVIRDILHRLRDRFPRHVLLWPVAVQGERAAEQIAAAILGCNAIEVGGPVPRPDLLIVARGGGSVEDLWSFNEEIVVRATAESLIPLISAVGHETDTTLIDFASDRRAPTPTAAAEMAVPVRAELQARVLEAQSRLVGSAGRLLERLGGDLRGLARGLPHPTRLVEQKNQDLDNAADSLRRVMTLALSERRGEIRDLAHRLRHPRETLAEKCAALAQAAAGLRPAALAERLSQLNERLDRAGRAMDRGAVGRMDEPRGKLDQLSKLLESLSYRSVLERGYAVVRSDGVPQTRAAQISEGSVLAIEFADGEVAATAGVGAAQPSKPKPAATTTKPKPGGNQGALF
ncbi:MAG: exodeoxyribonuclease VII large subunit [Rhodospirillaceae bacterium]|nr:exodeoxyribonuclease VII large subunit [Rhodospirillaceae bacterium]